MGCSNARLLVQAPSGSDPGARTNNSLSPSTAPAPSHVAVTDSNNTTTRMHLTGVDLVVERNGSYTLLLTPKTHKQLMPYVLRKKRFRILVDKPRSDPTLPANEPIVSERIMENQTESKQNSKKTKKSKQNPLESTLESVEQVAADELHRAQARFVGGRSIDRGDPEDDDENIQSDDEGMIEEIITTIEEDKDLECKVKKKIETKRTVAQHPETHNTITKVVKTEVTEITRTITINDHHDLERAKRELGIDDVNRLLPTAHWVDQTRYISEVKEKRYEPTNEVVTSKDFPSSSPIKQTSVEEERAPLLAESTTVGRGPVIETIPPASSVAEVKPIEVKKKKKKSKLCSCTRSTDEEYEKKKPSAVVVPTDQKKETSVVSAPALKSMIDTQHQGQQLISNELKQLIIEKKPLLIEYIHAKIFAPSKIFASAEQDTKARKISARILDLLRYDRCSSWKQMAEQLTEEYAGQSPATALIQPMVHTYENLFTSKQSNFVNTFSTIHQENDIQNIQENSDYIAVVPTVLQQQDNVIPEKQADDMIERTESIPEEEKQVEKVINDNAEAQPIKEKELQITDKLEESSPIYNEEQLIKMLADISQHKPITLAEAIAYEYLDIEDPKLGLSNDTIQRMKKLFRPSSDQSSSNLIRVKRSGEYLNDINLVETNPFEKFHLNEPYITQLQQSFEPTLDFNEKQFRSLTETILNNKEQYEQLQFDVAHTSLPVYDLKDSSTNDFSQSDSGYSMTTATHDSLASKIKIEFEPIQHDLPIIPKRDDLEDDEKIDLDKATPGQLNKYELNQDLIQIIKSDFHGSDKTIGQAILSRELRLDSSDPNDIAYLNSLGIHKEQAKILTKFFFPKQTRIIAYSPEPGRFVEAQTTYNPEYPGYKTDTTIIQIQEKQLSSDHLAMQRNIHDDRASPAISEQVTESDASISTPVPLPAPLQTSQEITATDAPKEQVSLPSPPPPPVHVKKRKSSGSGGLLSCFKSKKPKAGTEQQGQATLQSTTLVSQTSVSSPTAKPTEEKPLIDYAILPDGKRIYIDVFRDRPGFDMSYKPDDFENRFVLPVAKPTAEYERSLTPEPESVPIESQVVEDQSTTPLVESAEVQPEITEHKVEVHLEPRSPTIEPVDVQPESPAAVVPITKTKEVAAVTKKPSSSLHGAAFHLPDVQLVTPEILPSVSLGAGKTKSKVKKSSGGLCASCFGSKAAEKKKKESAQQSVAAPVELKKTVDDGKKEDLPPITNTTPAIETPSSELPATNIDKSVLPKVNIDVFRERNFENFPETTASKPEYRSNETTEVPMTSAEPNYQSSAPSLPPATAIESTVASSTKGIDSSIFSKVNIDTFKERTFEKSSTSLPKSQERPSTTEETVTSSLAYEEPHYQSPTATAVEPVPISPPASDKSNAARVNIDSFRERTFEKNFENLPKSQERLDQVEEKQTIESSEERNEQLINTEPVSSSSLTTPTTDSLPAVPSAANTSNSSVINIDTFKERTFEKSFESLPKSQERLNTTDQTVPSEEPNDQSTTNDSLSNTATVEPLPLSSTNRDASNTSPVNIDSFRERTFEKSFESLPKKEERSSKDNENVTSAQVEEPLNQVPTKESVLPSTTTAESSSVKTTTSSSSRINIDTYRERTFDKSFESLPKSQERLDAIDEKVKSSPSSDEPHYQLPTNEPVSPTSTAKPTQSTVADSSIFSKVNIDTFRERTFENTSESFSKSNSNSTTTQDRVTLSNEEPHYQLPSGEPLPPQSDSTGNQSLISEQNTYDTPRTLELQQTTPSIEKRTEENITMHQPTTDLQKSSGDFVPIEVIGKTEITSKVDNKESEVQKKKKKSKEPKPKADKKLKEPKVKTDKKSNVFSTIFRANDHQPLVPALDLPSVERDLTPNNQPHRPENDPLHVPSTNLPKPDIRLPTYDRPEVDMTTGKVKQGSEFAIPVVDFTQRPDLFLSESSKPRVDYKSDPLKIPNVQLPDLQSTLDNKESVRLPHIQFKTKVEQIKEEVPIKPTVETGLALASPIDDLLSIQTDHKNFPIETDYAIKTEATTPKLPFTQTEELLTNEQKYSITDIHASPAHEVPSIAEKQTKADLDFQLPSSEPISDLSKQYTSPPSFENDVPSAASKIVPTVKTPEKQLIENKPELKKKSSALALCSCFGHKSTATKEPSFALAVPKTDLPPVELPVPSANISSTLKMKKPLRIPSTDLPAVDLTLTPPETVRLPSLYKQEKKPKQSKKETDAAVPSVEVKNPEISTPSPVLAPETQVNSDVPEKQPLEQIKNHPTQSKRSPPLDMKIPVMDIPELDLPDPSKNDAYLSFSKQPTISIPEQIQSRSDSGLEAIVSSHMAPSSTFGTTTTIEDIQQYPSVSSGLGSEILDSMTSKGYSLSDVQVPKGESQLSKHDFTRKITVDEESRAKLIFRQNDLKQCLEKEIAASIDDFDPKKDQKSLERILTHGIDLIKDKTVTTYPELKQKLIFDHKNEAFIVDPVVRSLYCTMENQGLDNFEKPEFPLAIRDMVRLPAKQTYETVTHWNKETTPLTTTSMTQETPSPILDVASSSQAPTTIEKKSSEKPLDAARSCLTCGRSKSKTTLPATTASSSSGLLDERRRLQLNIHRTTLGNVLRDHIQSSQPPIRKFADHPKESEKILRKGLSLVTQPKILSYEQLRHDLKTEYKQTFYLIDPTVDIIRDTFDHCDISQMNEKINLDILDSNISQTAHLYNRQSHLLTSEEIGTLKSNQLSWLPTHLIAKESKEKKSTRKQNKELSKILTRSLELLSSDCFSNWDELTLQLQREYPKAHDLCQRSVELLKQSKKDGLLVLDQAPISQEKRRTSSLITDRARQNLKSKRLQILSSLENLLTNYNQSSTHTKQLETYLNKTLTYLEEQKPDQFKTYQDLKEQLKKDFHQDHHEKLIEQIVDVIEQAHATNQFDDIDKPEVQALMKDRLDGKSLVIKEMYVSLPPRIGGSNDFGHRNGDQSLNHTTSSSHPIARGLSWREANERARILFYRGKHPTIHYDEKAAAFDVRMVLETPSGGTQEIPVTDSDVHELLNSCGVQWDGLNIISLVDHSEDVVRAAEQAALKVIREKGIMDLRAPPATTDGDDHEASVALPTDTSSS